MVYLNVNLPPAVLLFGSEFTELKDLLKRRLLSFWKRRNGARLGWIYRDEGHENELFLIYRRAMKHR